MCKDLNHNKTGYIQHRKLIGPGGAARSVVADRPRTLAEWFEYGRRCFHKPDGVEAVRALRKVTDLHPGYRHYDGDNAYFYLGKIHEVEGRLSHAAIFYSRALAVNPQDEESLIGRGSCYTLIHRHESAIHDFERLLRFPSSRRKTARRPLYLVIAENYRRLGQWGQVIFWETLAEDADPGDHRQDSFYQMLVSALRQ